MRRISFLFASFVLAPLSQAVVWADDINDATVLDFGARSIFRGVGLVDLGIDGYGTGTYIGTGNGSGWVLTAAHVLDLGQSATFNVPSIGDFSITGAWSFEDISVARITSSNANLLAGVATPRLNLNPLVAGTNVVSAGFGYSGAQSSPNYNPEDYLRRGFQSVVNRVYTDSFGTWVEDRFDRPGDRNKRPVEAFGAPGDSGSAFIDEANYSILGVLTGGDPEYYGGLNDYSALRPVVSQQIYSLTGINPVPEPASMAALGLGMVAMLRRRKRA